MPVIVRIVGAADGSSTPHDGRWVRAWNPHTRFGTLDLTSTPTRALAHRFKDVPDVYAQWHTISDKQLRRPDGNINKPLTAVNIEIEATP